MELPHFSITVATDVLVGPPVEEMDGSAWPVLLEDGATVLVARFLRHKSIPPGAVEVKKTLAQLDGLPATDQISEWEDKVCLKREALSDARAYWLWECSTSRKVEALREDFARVGLEIHDR